MKKIYTLFLMLMATSFVSIADTHIPAGNVSGTWSSSGSPYIIDGEISVALTDQLTINPGVTIVFSNHYKFNIYGRIEAVGSDSDSIRFTAQVPSTGWGGLRFINNNSNGQSDSKLAYCSFKYGRATGTSVDRMGGAIYCYNSSQLLIDHCTLTYNQAQSNGGAIYCENSDIRINRTVIAYNEANYSGGGIYCTASSPELTHVTLSENQAGSLGGALYNATSWPQGHPELNNCILWNDQPGEIESSTINITVTYSDIRGGWTGSGNISQDPAFIDEIHMDFGLTPCSPCIDMGNPGSDPDPDGTTADMGALYFDQQSATVISGGAVSGTWTVTGSPYYVCGNISVTSTSTLNIEPGVEVVFMGHFRFMINGRILATGNASDSIVFTALTPAAGWFGFRFENTNSNGQDSSRLEYCRVEYGIANGTSPYNLGGGFYMSNSSKIAITHSTIKKNTATSGGGIYLDASSPRINECVVSENTPSGIVAGASSSPVIENSVVESSSSYGINLNTATSLARVSGCQVNNGGTYPVMGYARQFGNFSDNSYYGNNIQKIYVIGDNISLDAIWEDPGIPYQITGNITIQGMDGIDGVTVLEIESGCEILMSNQTLIQVGHASNSNYPGGLIAQGNVNDSIVFTAGTSSPAPGYWNGILFENFASDPHCLFDYCVVEYGGYSTFENVYCNHSSPTFGNSSFRYGSGPAIYLESANSDISSCRIYESTTHGIYVSNSSPVISDCEISNNYYNGLLFVNSCPYPVVQGCNIHDNNLGIYADGAQNLWIDNCSLNNNSLYGIQATSNTVDIIATNCQADNNGSYPVCIYAYHAGGFSGNSYSGNAIQKIYVSGSTVTKDAVWENPGIPYSVSGHVYIQGTDGVNGVTTVNIEPGCHIGMGSGISIYCGHDSNSNYPGGLIAEGTESEPVLFTAETGTPVPGFWSGIYFAQYSVDSLCSLDHCIVEYGGYSSMDNIYCYQSAPSIEYCISRYSGSSGINAINCEGLVIDHCIIAHNNTNGIECSNGAQPVFTNNTICSNGNYGIYANWSVPYIANNILYENYAPVYSASMLSHVSYNDIWLNDTVILSNLPTGFANLVTQNINGRPCDQYFNIFLDPFFENPAGQDYQITMYSPCINAGDPNLPYDPDNSIADIGAYYYTLDGDPVISAILDIPNDQGKQVSVTWLKSPLDALGSPAPVSFYTLWRYDDYNGEEINGETVTDPWEAFTILGEEAYDEEKIIWENGDMMLTYIMQVPAIGFDQYTVVAPTLFDSCETSINYTTFQVLAHMASPQMYYASQPDSGYSVDNLAPHVPENFTGLFANGQVELNWSPVPDEDFQYYALYRSTDPSSFPSVPFTATIDTLKTDQDIIADTVYYMVTAFDFNGNESGPSQIVEVITFSGLALDIRVFLEGPYSGPGMQTTLNSGGQIPLSQPYNQAPWNYNGTESVATIPNSSVVDWVLVELRDAPDAVSATSATMVDRQAGFVMNDGVVTATDGISQMVFSTQISQNLFVVIRHRNHIAVMSASPLANNGGIYQYDFSTGSAQAYGGVNAHKQVAPGIWGMTGADGNADNQVNNGDKNDVWATQAGTGGYLSGDFNLDAEVNNSDKNDIWVPNTGLGGQVPQ